MIEIGDDYRTKDRRVIITEPNDGFGFTSVVVSVTIQKHTGVVGGEQVTLVCSGEANADLGYIEHDGGSCPIHEPE